MIPVIYVPCSVRTVPAQTTISSATDVGTNRGYDNGAVTVVIANPSWDGKMPITTFTAATAVGSDTPSGSSTGTQTTRTVTGLNTTSGGTYTFTAYATNAIGNAPNSFPYTGPVTVTSVPDRMSAPTVSTPAYNVVTVSFTAPNSGGKTITDYSIVSSPSIALTQSGSGSSRQVTGNFVAGTAYTFTIAAINANGTGTASPASAAITPNNVSGGTEFTQGAYRYHVFTSTQSLTVTGTSRTLVETLIVGGGGAGGSGGGFGSGGGGGASDSTTFAGQTLTTGSYTVVVGNAGTAAAGAAGGAGGSSSFNSNSRAGGGGGGYYFSAGLNGSCGGGGGLTAGGTVAGGTGSEGGNGQQGGSTSSGAGGGSAAAAGNTWTTANGTNYSTWYKSAGTTVGVLGVGGPASSGAAGGNNTGNGGGGISSGTAGAGGSGMVIVRYPA